MNYYKNKNHEGVFTLWMNRARCGCETYFAKNIEDNARAKAYKITDSGKWKLKDFYKAYWR